MRCRTIWWRDRTVGGERDREELANALTHGAGVLLSLAGAVVLAYRAAWYGSLAHTIAVSVYGASLVGAFTASTLYHATSATRAPRRKRALLWLDHSCIYALIAGTYTPFMVSVLKEAAGTAVLCTVWGLAAAGMAAKMLPRLQSDLVSVPFSLLMGWLVLVVLGPLASQLGASGIALLLAGGLCYSLGVIFFLVRRTYFHAVWHGFVLAGGRCTMPASCSTPRRASTPEFPNHAAPASRVPAVFRSAVPEH